MIFITESDAATRELGRKVGKRLKPGDVVCLYGELGAGKTTMVKGIASALGISERDITSASFTIIAEYDTDVPFYHIDLYRVTKDEVPELGINEYLDSGGISVIEWAEKIGDGLPERCISVMIEYVDDNSRRIEAEGIEI